MPASAPPISSAPPICRGEVVRFLRYAQAPDGPLLFEPRQRLVVAAVNADGSLQCFPLSQHGSISYAGDTVFSVEILRSFPLTVISLPHPWSNVEPCPTHGEADLSRVSAAWRVVSLWLPGR